MTDDGIVNILQKLRYLSKKSEIVLTLLEIWDTRISMARRRSTMLWNQIRLQKKKIL